MIRYILFSFCLFLSVSNILAQDEVSFKGIDNIYEREKIILSLPLLTQLDINSPSLGLALDVKLTKWLGVHQELGYVNNWLNPFFATLENSASDRNVLKNGVKYVIEPRLYPFYKKGAFASRMFFAPSFDFRYVNIGREEWMFRNNFSYRQLMKYKVNKLAYGGLVKFGFTTNVKKFMPVDFVFGLGARIAYLSNNLPDDASRDNNTTGLFFLGNSIIEGEVLHPSVLFGIYLHLPVDKK